MNTIKNTNKIHLFISLLIPFTPLLNMYTTNISSITFLDVILVFSLFVIIWKDYKGLLDYLKLNYKKTSNLVLIIAISGILINLIIHIPFYSISKFIDIGLRAIRLIFYIFFIFLVRKYINIDISLKAYKCISLFAIAYLMLQYILLFFFDYSLQGYLPFLPLARPELATYTENLTSSLWARPRSIFAEPSQIALFVGSYLAISMLVHKENNLFLNLFLTVGLFLSSSTSGILISIVIWGLYCFRIVKNKIQITKKQFVLFLLLFIVGIFIYVNSSSFELFLNRFQRSFINRFEGFIHYFLFIYKRNLFDILFGYGMDLSVILTWASGFAKILYFYGFVGLTVFFKLLLSVYRILSNDNRYYLLIIFIIGIFTELWVSNWLILYLPVLFNTNKNEEDNLKMEEIWKIHWFQ